MSTQYRVYVTPLKADALYGPEYEISDWVDSSNVGAITRSIDSTDYGFGLYTFNDVTLVCDNSDGKLGDSTDSRSIFVYGRDKAKVRIVYDNGSGSPPVTFYGLIFEEGTQLSMDDDSITLQVTSLDGVLIKSPISAGTVADGSTFSQALLAILGTSDITSILTVQLANINPSYNGTVDSGAKFDNMDKKKAIEELLAAANSVLLVDSSFVLHVQSRAQTTNPTVYLYGKGDLQGRENIYSLQNYNTGLQRVFNSVTVKGGQLSNRSTTVGTVITTTTPVPASTLQTSVRVDDTVSQGLYGFRPKEFTFEWLTTQATLQAVAQALLAEFAYPKIEFEVTVATDIAYSVNLLDRVSMSYPLRVSPAAPAKFMFTVGVSKVGDVNAPIANATGAVTIDASLAFKVIEIQEDPQHYTTLLKLRQVGTTLSDGHF